MENGIAFRKRNFGVHAINRRGRSDRDFFDAGEPGRFQQIHRAFHIHALIQRRFLEARTHSGARGKMDDLIELYTAEGFTQCSTVGEVSMNKFKWLRQRLDVADIAALNLRIVKRIEIVEGPNGMAGMKQSLAYMRANEAC